MPPETTAGRRRSVTGVQSWPATGTGPNEHTCVRDQAMFSHDTTSACDLDRWLEALACRPRRRVLQRLVERPDEGIELTEIARECDRDTYRATETLHHRHLPKLEEVGLIEWDRGTGTVTPGPRFRAVRPLVEAVVAHDDHLADSA